MVQLKQVNNHLNNKIMDKEYVMHIAQTIKEQLHHLPHTRPHVVGSQRICRYGIPGIAGTAAESKRTVTRRICRYRSQRLLITTRSIY